MILSDYIKEGTLTSDGIDKFHELLFEESREIKRLKEHILELEKGYEIRRVIRLGRSLENAKTYCTKEELTKELKSMLKSLDEGYENLRSYRNQITTIKDLSEKWFPGIRIRKYLKTIKL